MAAALTQLTPPQPQQLGDRRRFAFTPLQRHQRQVEGAATEVDHEQSRSRGQAGTKGRGGGFVHQGDLLHRQCSAGLQQPVAVVAIGLHRRSQHQAFHPQGWGQVPPDPLEQQGAGPCCPIAFVPVARVRAADVALEVSGQVGIILIGMPRLNHLLPDQWGVFAQPQQAGDFADLLADGGEIKQARVALTSCREGHHRRGAAQVDGQGARES